MRVRENTAQAASVEFLRTAQKLCAQQTVSLLSEKPEGFFDSLERAPVRASLFSSPPHPSRFLNGGCRSDLYKIANGYAAPSVHFTAFRCEMQSPPLDRKENFGYNRRYNRCGGVYAVRR